ncbi:cysteine desulfurase family protein [Bacillus sp. FJAT-26390]|uniref:cysteine desulfurase family protein n=1 Tax=Bacillus sp. FJAT-26390 TaxID=1743142 RepID=UPI000807F272|nr:cysteine desulfurase family protein [Bacillus sp. FJAT-26390]OBZ12482.1 cysteine desulfurase NifS [Bacillus sp. FJAT-26390]
MKIHYFDHAATTPMHPSVASTMLELMQGPGGNSSSMHALGRAAKQQLNRARDSIAAALGCKPGELLFTSGGTESDNAALIGAARAQRKRGKSHIITSAGEHHAVLHTCEWLAKEEGFTLTVLPLDNSGRTSPELVQAAITPETGLISIMHGNNEVGTLQPIEEIGQIAKASGAIFHVDAVQALSSINYRLNELPVDLMSFSAHKINGPQGVGALYVANGTLLEAIQHGGSQERKRRAGTENIAGIAGFAAAVDICVNERENKQPFMDKLRKRWIELLQAHVEVPIVINGNEQHYLPHIVNVSFIGVDTETMLMNLDMEGIAAASGSACTSGALERSHVLRAMQLPEDQIHSAVRFSFGLGNTLEELEDAAQKVGTIVRRIRNNY